MKKLSIEEVFSPIKKELKEPKFYYKYFLQYGQIFYTPWEDLPGINLDLAVKKVYAIDQKAGTIADKLASKLGQFDLKNLFHHIEYRMGKFINYVPSKPLLEVLSKIKVDMPSAQLPIGLRAYFELSGFSNTSYLLVSTHQKPDGVKQIKITVTEQNVWKDSTYFGVDLTEGTLEESVKNMPYSEMIWNEISKEYVRTDVPISGASLDIINLASNLLIYISNPNEDFKTQYNEFSKNNKEAQRQKQIYTERPFIALGENLEFLKLVREQEVGVMGHFRWQPIGEGRKQRKLIFIQPHIRHYKGLENGN